MFTGDAQIVGHSAQDRRSHPIDDSRTPAADRRFDSIDRAIGDIAAGKAVVVIDDEDRENEGDIIFAAEKATTELVAFTVRYSSGYLCVPMTGDDCDRLDLPPMYRSNEDPHGTAYTVTVDVRTGTSTGISARDRARTIRALADADSVAADFSRPGHVVPLRARDGGVLRRPGHTEAAVDLTRLAGLNPVGVVCEIVSEDDPTTMARTPELREFADAHGLALITIADLAEWRRTREQLVTRGPVANVPTTHGTFRAVGYTGAVDGREHVALLSGRPGAPAAAEAAPPSAPATVRIHSECLTGDVFGSTRCGCGHDLGSAMDAVSAADTGVVVYLREAGAHGEGLVHTLRSLALDESAAAATPPAPTTGDLHLAAQMLADLGFRSVRLLTCEADESVLSGTGRDILAKHGIDVVEVAPAVGGNPDTAAATA
ncbi:3,4-dihydroxy-2-butanone-4-phosphate synthase [Tomitella fengzijianii]|uniref:3,4-dihydroxy-2-butanone 4-phosphate synthase n=2 Tax=Tomitella fengzijianii TaxID=2597660 RepID=A0A516X740_9ACTN|nr:3,4-dihydroxy-2-butanone-4-phosphate synthase [Tomitella fengzijianii]QDQ98889.1 3,4-dihydroxy-2-butanone-4-phosphate synthase [Tomitella fengzijianii]